MPNESPLLLLIDGHSMVFRAWFAIKQELATSDGVPTRGARGFISMLFKTIKDHNPSHIAVTFDTKAPTFRDEMYAEYKAGRPPIDPDLHLQIPIAKKILAALKIPVYELDGYEADDLVGTISRNATDAGARTIILTGDADQLQVVSDQTKLLMYSGFGGNKMYGIDEVKAKYDGLGPEYVPQIKALAGDKSDNIPGIPGVGDKSALTLLNHYKGLDQIYADLESVQDLEKLRGAKRVMNLLSEHRDSAYKSLELATIVYDAPINFDLKDALFGDYDIAEAKEAFLEYEFRSFVDELSKLPKPPAKPLLLLINGQEIVLSAWNTTKKELATSDGVPTRGAYWFFFTLFEALEEYKPTHLAVTFNTKLPKSRNTMFPEYEEEQQPEEQSINQQTSIVKELLTSLKIPVYERKSWKSNDIIGTISRIATSADTETVILTNDGDSDLFQLATGQTKLIYLEFRSYSKLYSYGIDQVKRKNDGLEPKYVSDINALVRGVPGVGKTSACTLIKHYGGLKQIYADLESVQNLEKLRGAKRVMTQLRKYRDQAHESWESAKIKDDAPIKFELKDTANPITFTADGKFQINDKKIKDLALEAFLKYEFRTFAEKLISFPIYGPEYRIVDNPQRLQELISELRESGAFAFDVETDSTDPFAAKLVGISFATKADEGWYVPVGHNEGQRWDTAELSKTFRDLFGNPTIPNHTRNGGQQLDTDWVLDSCAMLWRTARSPNTPTTPTSICPSSKPRGLRRAAWSSTR